MLMELQIKELIEENFLIDKADTGQYVPFIFNKAQVKYYEELMQTYNGNLVNVREIILKARKEGFTSLILAIFAAIMFLSKHPVRFLEISYKDDATKQHFRRIKNFILSVVEKDHTKWNSTLDKKVFRSITEGNEFVLNGNGASFYAGTASVRTGERGGTVQGALFSEAGHYPDTGIINAAEIIEATRNMIAVNSGLVFIESTANGVNFFKKIWDMAEKREVDYRPRFYSWRDFYTENEFNDIKAGFIDKRMIPQEYPANPNEAFLKDSDRAIIPASAVMDCVGRILPVKPVHKRMTVCDVAGEGSDETVIYDMMDARIENEEIYSHVHLMDSVGRIQYHATKNKSRLICVDKVGEGAGVYARLDEIYRGNRLMKVYGFDGRTEAPGKFKETYANYKSYAWYEIGRRAFLNHQASIPNDYLLIEELSTPAWEYRNGKIAVQVKDKIKDNLGRSPNRGDAYIMALDALSYCALSIQSKEEDDKAGWQGGNYEPEWARMPEKGMVLR